MEKSFEHLLYEFDIIYRYALMTKDSVFIDDLENFMKQYEIECPIGKGKISELIFWVNTVSIFFESTHLKNVEFKDKFNEFISKHNTDLVKKKCDVIQKNLDAHERISGIFKQLGCK